MADSTEGGTEVQYLSFLLSVAITLLFGLVIHSFIIAVNVNDWWKGRSVTAVENIVTSLGISRMCAQCANTLYIFISAVFQSSLDLDVTMTIIGGVYTFFISANIWLTSLLSIVFCLKISNFHTRLFLYLRSVILQRTVYFIVASMLFSILNNLITLDMTYTKVTNGGTYNTTKDCIFMTYLLSYSIGASIQLLFFYISSVLLFTSLYQHTTRMKRSSNLTINLETYYSVMKLAFFTFIYNTMYFIDHFACVFYYSFYCVSLPWLYILLDFLPTLHSSYLIYKTAKLRNQMSKVLLNVSNVLFQRQGTGTRVNIEIVTQ